MQYYLVATSAHIHASHSSFTYASEEPYEVGAIVLVPLGKKEVPGIVIRQTKKPDFDTKNIRRALEDTPLPVPLIELASWMTQYYQSHAGNVWQTLLPRGLQKQRRQRDSSTSHPRRKRTNIILSRDQESAVTSILSQPAGTTLLEGITGSGKTQVYIELAQHTLREGGSVIILVPEISLTAQLVAELKNTFEHVIVTHSTMTEAERHNIWRHCLKTQEPTVVVGPRSALFSPLRNLGLIIIDECHEPSFKQEQAPRYSALRAASVLASLHSARLVLGSATPTIADRYIAEQQQRPIVRMLSLATPNAVRPVIRLVPMKEKARFSRHRFLSNDLLDAIAKALQEKAQILIFHNRRGSAPLTLCEQCGWSAVCQRCYTPLTLHVDRYELTCHVCNAKEKVPTSCPQCQQTGILHKGIGTKLIESELQKLFPKASIGRFDSDTTAEASVATRYQELYDGSIDILIGTQTIAKGLDLPQLRVVGIVQADSGLALPDYQSAERVFQLVAQVRGRVGRNHHASTFIIQTYQPEHPSIRFGLEQDYEGFYKHEIMARQQANFPPFTHLLKATCVYKTEAGAIRACRALAKELASKKPQRVTILGPAPAFYERVRDTYRWQLLIKSPDRNDLIDIAQAIPAAKWQVDIDPISLL